MTGAEPRQVCKQWWMIEFEALEKLVEWLTSSKKQEVELEVVCSLVPWAISLDFFP